MSVITSHHQSAEIQWIFFNRHLFFPFLAFPHHFHITFLLVLPLLFFAFIFPNFPVFLFPFLFVPASLHSSPVQVITSQEKEITIKRPNGETTTATVRIWNETVSNLTLMALGSSAPEILLSVIEVSTI